MLPNDLNDIYFGELMGSYVDNLCVFLGGFMYLSWVTQELGR
jgi:hypothetical protein